MRVTRKGGRSHIKLHTNLVGATILHFNLCETLSSSCYIKWQFAYCATQMSDLKCNFTALHAKGAILKRYYLLVLFKPTQLSKGVKFWMCTHTHVYMFYRHIHVADSWLDGSGHVMQFQRVYSICLYLDLSGGVIAPLRSQTKQHKLLYNLLHTLACQPSRSPKTIQFNQTCEFAVI